jgi:hypothetical protein
MHQHSEREALDILEYEPSYEAEHFTLAEIDQVIGVWERYVKARPASEFGQGNLRLWRKAREMRVELDRADMKNISKEVEL